MSATRCYCGARLLDDGRCRHRCDPAAKPSVLRAKLARERKARRKALGDGERIGMSGYLGAMSQAIARFDPITALHRAKALRGARKSHRPGNRRHGRG